MKKLFVVALVLLVAVGMTVTAVSAGVGNGLPSGAHYNLNIIGMDSETKEVGDSSGHTLFVNLNGKTKITMTQDLLNGEFDVVDRDGVTDNVAEFNIAPGYYNVYARALGKPDKGVVINAYGNFTGDEVNGVTDTDGNVLVLLGTVAINRESKKPVSLNINELFYVDVTITDIGAGTVTTYEDTWVFGIDELLEYYWDYENDGLRLLQVRFYECNLAVDGEDLPDNYCCWPDGTPIYSHKDVAVISV